MAHRDLTFSAQSANGFTEAFQVGADFAGVVISGTFTATAVLQASADGSTWVTISSTTTYPTSLTAAGMFRAVNQPGMFFRVLISAYTSGIIVAQIPGQMGSL